MFYQWAVIGAGPAGIAAIGKLLDEGIAAQSIAWIDPHFTVGDFGTTWRNVPSNTKVELFLKYLHAANSFEYKNCPRDFAINHLDPKKTCNLSVAAEALQWVSEQLKNKVNAIQGNVEMLSLKNRQWHIKINDTDLCSKNVILAVGANPKNLSLPVTQTILLSDAIDHVRIKNHITAEDTIAVFGSSHSAILVLRNLVENNVKHIINFYQIQILYAAYFNDWILFDDTGLKGVAAEWARTHIDGKLPANLQRVYSNTENIEKYLPQCNKAIYAVGFERRTIPIENMAHLNYIEQCGIIAPGLFGIGIAFPEAKYNPLGMLEYRVGLWKFMDYLHRVLPIWLNYST
jgi:hypothetical protein